MNHTHLDRLATDLADAICKRVGISHEAYFDVLFKALAPWERRWADMLRAIWDEERRIIIANLRRLQPKRYDAASKGDQLVDSVIYPKRPFIDKFSAKAKALLIALIEAEGIRVLDVLGIDIAFNVTNPSVADFIAEYAYRFSEELERVSVSLLRKELTAGMAAGETIPELMLRVEKTYKTWNSQRAEIIARTETSRASNRAALESYRQSGVVTRKVWMTAPGCCDFCAELDGRVVGLEEPYFNKGDEFTITDDEGRSQTMRLDYEAVESPPIHPNCYDDATDVYTDSGWQRFADVGDDASVLTINPENKSVLWVKPAAKIAYHYRGNMIRFSSRSLDMMVTPDHEVVYRKRWDKRMGRGDVISRIAAKDLPSEVALPRGIQWDGEEMDVVNVGGIIIPAETFCRFMGYWLSEGSVSQRSENCYQISIAQYQSAKYKTMKTGLAGMPLKISGVLPRIYIFNVVLGQYLLQFGKSQDKYVPRIIKDMSARLIKIFLDAYCLGDGNIKAGKADWRGGGFEDQRTYFTASKRMADDLGELILKTGHRPSFSLVPTKGVLQQFRNGCYRMNHDLWRITDCPRVWSHSFEREYVPYDGMVYCLDVPPNHTFWVRRNGKTVIGGNCRCAIAADID